jgi:hypothetical protein
MSSCAGSPLHPVETKVINPFVADMQLIMNADWIVTGTVLTRAVDHLDIKVLDIVKPGLNASSVVAGQTLSISTAGIVTSSIESTDIFCVTDDKTPRLVVNASELSVPEVKRVLANKWGSEHVPNHDELRTLLMGTGRSLTEISYETSSIYGTDARIVAVHETKVGPSPKVGDLIHQEGTDLFDLGRTYRPITVAVSRLVVLEQTPNGWTIIKPVPNNGYEDAAFFEQLQKEAAGS